MPKEPPILADVLSLLGSPTTDSPVRDWACHSESEGRSDAKENERLISTAELSVRDAVAEHERLENQLASKQVELDGADKVIANLKTDLDALTQSATEMRDAQAAAITRLQAMLEESSVQLTAAREQSDVLKTANDTLTNANTKLAEAVEYATEHDLKVEKDRAEKYRQGFERQSKAHEAAMASNAELREKVKKQDEEIAGLKAKANA